MPTTTQNIYIHFNGNTITEYEESKQISQNEIVWKSCTNYFYIVSDTVGPLKKGDTLEMNIIKYFRDTLILAGMGKGITMPMTFIKSKR